MKNKLHILAFLATFGCTAFGADFRPPAVPLVACDPYEYFKLAREFAARLAKEANDGDHLRLAFDRPGTWSQKYNLVWDRILGLNLFPAEVAQTEMAFYKKMQNQYGLPLDNRETYPKLDWITWTATLTEDREDFDALIAPIITFLNQTPDRSPMTDWYQTKTARKVGFTARPVVGGVFLKMLYDKTVWQKYARRDQTKAANWAPMPKAPTVSVIVPAADKQPAVWRYTSTAPADNWMHQKFDDAAWLQGESGFGIRGTPGAVIGTTWQTGDIWLRREVGLSAQDCDKLQAWLHHDEDAEIYINDVLAIKAGGFSGNYDAFPLTPKGKAALKPGKNLIAIHCHQTNGGQYIDVGLVMVQASDKIVNLMKNTLGRKPVKLLKLAGMGCWLAATVVIASPVSIADPRCEYRKNPVGLDAPVLPKNICDYQASQTRHGLCLGAGRV